MTTWYDRMNGYSTLPADKLELAMQHRSRPPRPRAHPRQRAPVRRCPSSATSTRSARTIRRRRSTRRSSARRSRRIRTTGPRSATAPTSRASPPRSCASTTRRFFWPDNAEAILVGDFDVDERARALRPRVRRVHEVARADPAGDHRRAAAGRRAPRRRQAAGQRRAGDDRLHAPGRGRIPTSSRLEVLAIDPRRRRQLAAAPGAGRAAGSRPT